MNQQKLCFFFILFFASSLWAANWSAPPKDNLGVKFGIAIPSLSTNLNPNSELSNKKVEYSPNSASSTFLSFSFQNVGLTLSRSNPMKEKEISNNGETDLTDYQLRFYGKYASTEFFYQKYQGYYIKNSEDVDSAYQGSDNRIKRPDLSTEHWGAQLIYNFHPDDLSIGAGFDQFQRQTSSGGSWLGLISIDHHKINADSPWVPTEVSSGYPVSKDFTKGLAVSGTIGGGYGFILTAANFYFSGILALGVGTQNITFSGLGQEKKFSRSASKWILRPSLGYNGENNYAGIQVTADIANYEIQKSESIGFVAGEVKFFYGHRFAGVSIPPAEWVSDLID